MSWVTTHRRHHQHSDRPGDPHSPISPVPRSQWGGLVHAHVGWLFRAPACVRRRDAADLLIDRDLRIVSGLFPVFAVLMLAVPFLAGWLVVGTIGGAVTALIWGGLVRGFLAYHATWSINSVCHTYGKNPFRTTDRSRNVAALAVLSLGESWHNAHHAFPALARHGVDRRQLDLTATCIRVWERIGLVDSVRWPDASALALRRIPVPARSAGDAHSAHCGAGRAASPRCDDEARAFGLGVPRRHVLTAVANATVSTLHPAICLEERGPFGWRVV